MQEKAKQIIVDYFNKHFVNCAVAYISNITSNVTINITYNQNNVRANLRWRVFIV